MPFLYRGGCRIGLYEWCCTAARLVVSIDRLTHFKDLAAVFAFFSKTFFSDPLLALRLCNFAKRLKPLRDAGFGGILPT